MTTENKSEPEIIQITMQPLAETGEKRGAQVRIRRSNYVVVTLEFPAVDFGVSVISLDEVLMVANHVRDMIMIALRRL